MNHSYINTKLALRARTQVLLVTLSRVAMETLQTDIESNLSSSTRFANLKNTSFSSPLRNTVPSPVAGVGGGHHFGRNNGSNSSNSSSTSTDFSKSTNVGSKSVENAFQRNPSIMSSNRKI